VTVTRKPITGESPKETVKAIARGMPGVSGVTVVTCLRAFYFCTQGCGRIERPAFPAPSISKKGRTFKSKLARNLAARSRRCVRLNHFIAESRLVLIERFVPRIPSVGAGRENSLARFRARIFAGNPMTASHLLRLMSVIQQGIFHQPDDAAIPGIVGSHAKVGLLLEHHAAVPGVADLKAHGIFGSARSCDDPDKGLVGAEFARDISLAATAQPQRLRSCRLRVGTADIDQTVAAGLRQQLARFVGGSLQLGNVLRRFANDPAAGAVILQLEIKHGNLDRGRGLGACRECGDHDNRKQR
jgi:hypothetical protein